MFRRFLRYIVIWLIILAVLCVLSIIKYRHEIINSIGGMFLSIAVPTITLVGIIFVILLMFRRR